MRGSLHIPQTPDVTTPWGVHAQRTVLQIQYEKTPPYFSYHQAIVRSLLRIMAGFKQAFSLSKAEVRNATPPGTVTLIGKTLSQPPRALCY